MHETDFVSVFRSFESRAQRILQADNAAKIYVLLEKENCLLRLNRGTFESQGLSLPPQTLLSLDDQRGDLKSTSISINNYLWTP